MKLILVISCCLYMSFSYASTKEPAEKFADPEATFKMVFKKLRENYVDKDLSDEELYRAATEGMLASLNSGKEGENWNALLSPRMLEEFKIDKTGKLTGIGITLELDPKTGYSRILSLIPNSAASKAGLRSDDQILSVDGKLYKGKTIADVAYAIRGPSGKSVQLKVLREDRLLTFDIKRNLINLTEVESRTIDGQTGLLTLSFFKEGTAQQVEQRLNELQSAKLKKLILDLRGNGGGLFSEAVKVGELFIAKGQVIVRTRARGGKPEEYKSTRDPWRPDVELVVLIDENTSSGAELLTSALKDRRNATTIGHTTMGKWNVQTLEILPNKFAVKYSVSKFESADGNNYQGRGLKPDFEIDGPKGPLLIEIQKESDIAKRSKLDTPFKAALEVGRTRSQAL